MKYRKCSRDGAVLIKTLTEWHCPKCGKSQPRFIKPNNGSPLFLNIAAKNNETKKFLEDVMVDKKQSWYIKEGNVFIKENGKIVDVRRVSDFADSMAKEVRER